MLNIDESQKNEWMNELNYLKFRCLSLKSETCSESLLNKLYDIESRTDLLILKIFDDNSHISKCDVTLQLDVLLDDLNSAVVMQKV